MIIRKATSEDMGGVLRLIKELAVFEKEPDAVILTENDLIKEGFGTNPSFQCFVAEQDQKVVGMALVYERFSTWKGKTVHLEDLIVRENFRNKGIGKALFLQVMKYAKSKGVQRVEWVVLDWNTNAISFYEKAGARLLKDWYLVQMEAKGVLNYVDQNESI